MGRNVRQGHLLMGAAAVLALLITPLAVAVGDDRADGAGSRAASTAKKFKKLSKKVKRLQKQVAALRAEQGSARPPAGPAGGDLRGSYPNPEIGANAVGTGELEANSVTTSRIAPLAVGSTELQDGSVTQAQIGSDAVGRSELFANAVGAEEVAANAIGQEELAQYEVVNAVISIGPGGGVGSAEANCPTGTQIVTGGAFFAFPSGDISASSVDGETAGWYGEGQNNGAQAQNLTVRAYCLSNGAP